MERRFQRFRAGINSWLGINRNTNCSAAPWRAWGSALQWLKARLETAWFLILARTSLVAQVVKCLPTVQETQLQSLGQKDLLEKEMATHSSILAWKIPWTEESGRLQSMGSQRVRHDWATSLSLSWVLLAVGELLNLSLPQFFFCKWKYHVICLFGLLWRSHELIFEKHLESERKWKLLSCVRLFVTPGTIQSMEFSRPEHWSG